MAITTHEDRELAREISMLRSQLKDFADSGNGSGSSIGDDLKHTLRSVRELLSRQGETAKSIVHDSARLRDKAGGALVHQTEAHPFSTVAAILGVGFLAGWLCRR